MQEASWSEVAKYLETPEDSIETAFFAKMTNEKLKDTRSKKELKAQLKALSDEELASAFVPDVYQKDIYHIDYKRLRENGIKLISFDVDDTIGDTMLDKLKANLPMLKFTLPDKARRLVKSLHEMGFQVILMTNGQEEIGAGAYQQLGADGYIYRAEKPDTKNFELAMNRYGANAAQMAHVGNNIRQDIGGGNAAGVTTCLVRNAGKSEEFGKFLLRMVGRKSKGHYVRKELKKRKLWFKHHQHFSGDQYYQLGQMPQYLEGDIKGLALWQARRKSVQTAVVD